MAATYEFCFRKSDGSISLKYILSCADDLHAKILARALVSREHKQCEVRHNGELVYEEPREVQ